LIIFVSHSLADFAAIRTSYEMHKVACMGAYIELLASGTPGALTLDMLRRLARQVVRSSTFPPPDGFSSWADGDAVDELICAMFVEKPQLVVGCAVKAHDDASMERLLLAAIKNWLIDQAKATEVGKLRRRLQNVLGEDARFVSSNSGQVRWWALTNHASTVWQGDIDRLHAAAYGVRGVQITRWNTSGPTPRETKAALIAVAYAVLSKAGGSVSAQDLSKVIAARFQIQPSPTFVQLSADAAWERDWFVDPTRAAVGDAAARDLWTSLSPDEQAIVPLLGADPEEVAVRLGAGPETAAALQAAIREKLRLATVDDDAAESVMVGLLRLAQAAQRVASSDETRAPAFSSGQDAKS
jgi:hypothetical protein